MLAFGYADGRLATVRDLAGSDWEYQYGDDGLLAAAVDPEGRTYLAADYDDAARVARAFADGRLHEYDYAADGTTVADHAGGVHALARSSAGVTTALESTMGACLASAPHLEKWRCARRCRPPAPFGSGRFRSVTLNARHGSSLHAPARRRSAR